MSEERQKQKYNFVRKIWTEFYKNWIIKNLKVNKTFYYISSIISDPRYMSYEGITRSNISLKLVRFIINSNLFFLCAWSKHLTTMIIVFFSRCWFSERYLEPHYIQLDYTHIQLDYTRACAQDIIFNISTI